MTLSSEAGEEAPTGVRAESNPPETDVVTFLCSIPPNVARMVQGRIVNPGNGLNLRTEVELPTIQIRCEAEVCNGRRIFRPTHRTSLNTDLHSDAFKHVVYRCSNCESAEKVFSIFVISPPKDKQNVILIKLGEFPAFGPDTPSRLFRLLGPARDLFLKRRRCESQGLGVGAFAYYRRIVEGLKDRIFDQLVAAAERLGADEILVTDLKSAKGRVSFTGSIENIRIAIPQSLLIKGHNPITLLHQALSDGLHARSDDECLQRAEQVRILLTALALRIEDALREEKEVEDAVKFLLKERSRDGQSSGPSFDS